jgi:hypothetical protein
MVAKLQTKVQAWRVERQASSPSVHDEQRDHLRADLDREHSAWELLVGATRWRWHWPSGAAVHRSVGDRYLLGLAEVLRARALNAGGTVRYDYLLAAVGPGICPGRRSRSARIGCATPP